METVAQAWDRMNNRSKEIGAELTRTHPVYRSIDLNKPVGFAHLSVEALSLVAPQCPYAIAASLVGMEIIRGKMCYVVDC